MSLYAKYPAFTSQYLIRYWDGTSSHLIGLSSLASLLGVKLDRVLSRVLSSRERVVVVRPFHGLSFTFIYR